MENIPLRPRLYYDKIWIKEWKQDEGLLSMKGCASEVPEYDLSEKRTLKIYHCGAHDFAPPHPDSPDTPDIPDSPDPKVSVSEVILFL